MPSASWARHQRSAVGDVVVHRAQATDDRGVPAPGALGDDLGRRCRDVIGQPVAGLVEDTLLLQSTDGERAHGLEQAERGGTGASLGGDERRVDEELEGVVDLLPVEPDVRADGVDHLGPERAGEHAEAIEQGGDAGGQEPVRPLDRRREAAVPLIAPEPRPGEDVDTFAQPPEDLSGLHRAGLRGGQLQREG